MPVTISEDFPVDIPVDGDVMKIRIKRQTVDEYSKFMLRFNRVKRSTMTPRLHRQPGEEDLSDAEVLSLREHDMSDDALAVVRAREDRVERESKTFLEESIAAFVTIEPGQLFVNGEEKRTGADLLQVFGARQDVLGTIHAHVFLENALGADQKKALRSRYGSGLLLPGLIRIATGEPPATTAPDAENSNLTSGETATATPTEASSGTTSDSGSPSAPSD